MKHCQDCLAPIMYAMLEVNPGEFKRIALDVRPLLEGDIVLREEPDNLFAKRTEEGDPDAMYQKHYCRKKEKPWKPEKGQKKHCYWR